MFLLIFFLFVKVFSIFSKGCLSISSDETCITCLSSYFENNYLSDLKIAATTKFKLSEFDCLSKENKKLIRKIYVLNSACFDCLGSDATYKTLPEAFEEESKLAIKFLESQITFLLQSGTHFIFPLDFSKIKPELFRRSKSEITIMPLNSEDGSVTIVLKTNLFYIFISKSLTMANISFVGSDIEIEPNSVGCSPTSKEICCNYTSFLDPSHLCYLNENQIVFSTVSEYRGLFNLEYIFDDTEVPSIHVENCLFTDFLLVLDSQGGFNSIFSMAPFSGKLQIYQSSIYNSYFPNGFAQFSSILDDLYANRISLIISSEYSNNINNLVEIFEFRNLNFVNSNPYFKKETNRASIFYFMDCNANITFDSLQFDNTINSNIVELVKGSSKGKFYFNNIWLNKLIDVNILKINDYVNEFSVFSVFVDNIVNSISLFSLNNINSAKIERLKISNLKINTDLGTITITNTNLNLTNSVFKNCIVVSIIFQTRFTLSASFLDFENISFSRTLIYLVNVNLFEIQTSYFTGLKSKISPFYISTSGILKFTSIMIDSSSLFSIFYIDKTNILYVYDLVAKNNTLNMISKEDQSCEQTFFTSSQIRNNVFSSRLYYIKNSAKTARILFDQVMISNNNHTSIAMITVLVGFLNFQKLLAINNFFFNPLYSYSFSFQEKLNVDIQNSYFENCGALFKKETYLAFTDNVFLYCWTLAYAFIRNNIFVVTKLIELVSGFISGSPVGTKVEIVDNQFFTISTNPKFGYKAILLDSLKYLRLENNIFFNSKCNSRTFPHAHGAVYISGSSSRSYSKNSFVAYINNNTFYNSSCDNGGNMAIISISKVEIKNCFFYNSSSNYVGGSMAIFSIPNLLIVNISTVGSQANEGGAFYFQNLNYSIFTNFSIYDAFARKNGAIYVKDAHYLEFNHYDARNTTSLAYGGFMFIFASNINITNGQIKFAKGKEGGAFFLHGRSNITFENNSISGANAEEAGAINIYDVNEIFIKNLKMDNLVGISSGAAIVFSIIKKVIIQDLIVESAISKGAGVVFCKSADDSGLMQITNMFCKRTQAIIGSCFYHLSAIPIEIVNLMIEENGDFPLYFRWSFAIQINLQGIVVIECKIDSSLIFISGVNIDFFDLIVNQNDIVGSIIYAQSSVFNVHNSRFINNNATAFFFENSFFQIKDFEITNPAPLYKLSFLFSTTSKGEIKNLMLTYLESTNNMLIQFDQGSLILQDINCLNNVGRLLTLSKANLNFSNSNIYNISTTDDTANEILYIKDDSSYNFVDIENINSTCFQSISLQFIGHLFVFLRNSSFEFLKLKANSALTSAIFASNLIELSIFNSSFINFTKNSIFMKTDQSIHSSLNVISSIFQKNEGSLGGALFLQGNIQILIKENIFDENQALTYEIPLYDLEGIGGCIFYQALSQEFDFKLFSNNFTHNYASRFISTVFSQSKILTDDQNIFSKNGENGKMISYPLSTKLASNLSEKVINVVSGAAFDLKLELVDMFGSLVYFDNLTMFTSKISMKNAENTAVILNPIGYTKEGLITFKNFEVKTNPNSNFGIKISGVFSGLQSKFISGELIETEYSFHARECYRGEIILPDFSCYKCPKGSFSLIDPMVIEVKYQRCYICPNDAECLGGDSLSPLPGFYRKSNISTNVVPCINAGACLGSHNASNLEVIHGKCEEGNSENLCFYCEFGYGRFDKQDYCKKCASISIQVYARLITYAFFMIAYILLNCHFAESFKSKDGGDKPNISTFTKFLVNHSQQISVIFLSSKTPVGEITTTLFQSLDYISFSNGTAISNDCLLQNIYFEKESFVILKEILILVLPIIFCFLSFVFWSMLNYFLSFTKRFRHYFDKIPKSFQQIKNRVILFLIISTIIFYPLILKACFNLFNCIQIDLEDNIKFLKDSPNMQCWGLIHTYYVIFFGLPGIFVWGISFPIFLTAILQRNLNIITQNSLASLSEANKNQIKPKEFLAEPANLFPKIIKFHVAKKIIILDKKSMLQNLTSSKTFMFFCRDYKYQFYYWESLIFFRKFFITFICTLDESISAEKKTLVMLIFIFLYINSTGKRQPYKNDLCNKLEMISLYTLGITVFSSLIFSSDAYASLKIMFFTISFFSNLIFYFLAASKIGQIIKKNIQTGKFPDISFRSKITKNNKTP